MNFMTNKNFYQRIGNTGSEYRKKDILANEKNLAANKNNSESILETRSNAQNITSSNKTSSGNKTKLLSLNDGNITTGTNEYTIVALTEGRGHAQREVGIASIDINSPSLLLSQLSDGFWYSGTMIKLQILNAVEILIPSTIYNTGSKILDAIRANFPNIILTSLPRRHFSIENTLELIQSLCSPECETSLLVIEKKYYALSAAAALLLYLKNLKTIQFIKKSLRVEYQTRYARMLIDHECCHRLELLYATSKNNEKKSCLYGVLDNTVTMVGKRYLRAHILEPFCDIKCIYEIQECIKEVIECPDFLIALEANLKKFVNVDKLLKCAINIQMIDRVKAVEAMLNQIILLKSTLENLPELIELLSTAKNKKFIRFRSILIDGRFKTMTDEIQKVIKPEANFNRCSTQCFQRIFAIRSGVNDLLDLTRNIYTELADVIRETINKLASQYELPLRMIHTNTRGFHMQLIFGKGHIVKELPRELKVLSKRGNTFFLTNADLVKLNVRMTDVINEIHLISEKISRNLIIELNKYIDAIHFLVGVIANLDVLFSLSKVSLKDGYICPTFGEETRIVDAIHPLLEFSRFKPIPVPNNIISTPEYNIFIITGPNMGGKTVYIKTIGILQIIAQLGCFVPAKSATFRICDYIFTRIGFEDKIEQSASSFIVEMKEMEYIYENITPNSIVLIDELCRSTNATEGKEIAWKLCEKFVYLKGLKNNGTYGSCEIFQQNSVQEPSISSLNSTIMTAVKQKDVTTPFIFITTHLLSLTKLADIHLNVVNLHLNAVENYVNDKLHLQYTHQVKEGITPIRGYGLSLARCIPLPDNILPRAEEILAEILEKEIYSVNSSDHLRVEHQENELKDICNSLILTNNISFQKDYSFVNSIASFINNNSNNNDVSIPSKDISINELITDFECHLFDLFSNIAGILRNPNSENEIFLITCLNNFISSLPTQLVTEIKRYKRPQNLPYKENNQNSLIHKKVELSKNVNMNKLSSVYNIQSDDNNINTTLSNSIEIDLSKVQNNKNINPKAPQEKISPKNINQTKKPKKVLRRFKKIIIKKGKKKIFIKGQVIKIQKVNCKKQNSKTNTI